MRFIFVNRFYWPEEPATAQLLTDLAEELAARGQDVTVITSHPGSRTVPFRETHRGVHIRRVRGTRTRGVSRILDFTTFHCGAFLTLLLTARRGDRLIALTDPPLLGVGAWLGGWLTGAKVYHWVQDIYPEIAERLTGHGWLSVLRPVRNLAWRRSDGCVVLDTDMAATVQSAGVAAGRIATVPNWAPAGLEPQSPTAADGLRRDWNLAGRFVVAYSGNLGRVHDLGPVLEVAAALQSEPGIAFVFIGSGPQRNALAAAAAARGLDQVQFRPPQRRERLNVTLALGDVHLVTLLPGCEGLVFPSKLYGAAAVGRPVLVIGPRESALARIVVANGIGAAFTRDDVGAIADWIRSLRQDPARQARLRAAAEAFHAAGLNPARAAESWLALAAGED
ncbi:MAG: glycosyltransferase family 4 protein [Verrucomicrobia bacterium]|nr:glycosyltransferase family 4 protein [Verrucomicrobiota bacterium]